jgi:glycine hydroxymethyltransferase
VHRVAGLSIALAEFEAFGSNYADQVVKNAQRLAEELYSRGLDVLGSDMGFTKSHQVLFKGTNNNGDATAKRLEDANIITTKTPLAYDKTEEECSGVRLGTQEITRVGMVEEDMIRIAELIKRVVIDREDPSMVREYVKELTNGYREVKFSFESGDQAYKYVNL